MPPRTRYKSKTGKGRVNVGKESKSSPTGSSTQRRRVEQAGMIKEAEAHRNTGGYTGGTYNPTTDPGISADIQASAPSRNTGTYNPNIDRGVTSDIREETDRRKELRRRAELSYLSGQPSGLRPSSGTPYETGAPFPPPEEKIAILFMV